MEEVTQVTVLKNPAATEQRPAWQDRAIVIAGYVLLGAVQLCVAAMSWAGLVGFGKDTLHLEHGAQYMVPISLDGASMAAAFMALRSVVKADSATGPRFLVALFTAASAWFNYHHADVKYDDTNAALFFGGMSVAALAMFDLVLRQLRRDALVQIGAVEAPVARFRMLRWLRYPRETFNAWSIALRRGYTEPGQALEHVWSAERDQEHVRRVQELDDLTGMSKAEAARAALLATGGKVPAALKWLAERGMQMDRSYAYDVARQLKSEQPREIAS